MTASHHPNVLPSAAPPRLVVFDLGGVIVRICRSWEEGCAAAGVEHRLRPLDAQAVARRKELNHHYQAGRLDDAAFFAAIADASGGMYSTSEIQRIHDAWLIGEYPGVADLIDQLHRLGVQTGILSNTNHAHWGRLITYPAIAQVQHTHASHLLGEVKPDEAIYHAYLARVGRHASEILFFDDLEENVAGAVTAGWRAVLVDHTAPTAPQIADALSRHGLHV